MANNGNRKEVITGTWRERQHIYRETLSEVIRCVEAARQSGSPALVWSYIIKAHELLVMKGLENGLYRMETTTH